MHRDVCMCAQVRFFGEHDEGKPSAASQLVPTTSYSYMLLEHLGGGSLEAVQVTSTLGRRQAPPHPAGHVHPAAYRRHLTRAHLSR